MVSSKFHIVGQTGEWVRIRVQEEIFSHGLEGSVLQADPETLAVIVSGDKSRIKRLHTDMQALMPDGAHLTDLEFNLQRPVRNQRIKEPEKQPFGQTGDYILQYLKQIEKRTIRIEQHIKRIEKSLTAKIPGEIVFEGEDDEPPQDDVGDDAKDGFAMMFG